MGFFLETVLIFPVMRYASDRMFSWRVSLVLHADRKKHSNDPGHRDKIKTIAIENIMVLSKNKVSAYFV